MKLLVICQYYYPEPFRITDICEELVSRGHEVTVITGIPNYPMGEIYPEYRQGRRRTETINGVKVHRCFTIGRKTGAVFRFLNYYSYSISSTLFVRRMKEKFDLVFVNQLSPVMMARAGMKYKKRFHTKLVLYCLDLWPESLVAGGIKRGSPVFRYYHKVSERIYRKADKILVTSHSFSPYLSENFRIKPDKIEYLPQYAENSFSLSACIKKPDDTIDLMFAGNVGAAQSVETIVRAAYETRDISNLRWHIVGDGSDLEHCKKLAEELGVTSVIFHGRHPMEEMPQYYSMADAMLVTMSADPILSLTLPGKVQSYMAAGKPIIGAVDGETALIMEHAKCGCYAGAGDYLGLSACARNFCNCGKVDAFCANSMRYYTAFFSRQSAIQQLEAILQNESTAD